MPDTTYCKPADVNRYLNMQVNFSNDTTPTLQEIQEAILDAEGEVNDATNNSWKSLVVTDEYYDVPAATGQRYGPAYGHVEGTFHGFVPLYMNKRNIKVFDTGEGDKIEVWDGSSYVDWVVSKTEGRNDDYWLDTTLGILYMRINLWQWFRHQAIRLTYRYGKATVPGQIRKATALMVALEFLSSDDRSGLLNETGDSNTMTYDQRVTIYQKKIDKIIFNNTEINVI